MIYLKSDEEVELIRISADILVRVHGKVAKLIKPGISTLKLDAVAEEFIRDNGGVPSFKGYNGFPGTLCVSPNEQVVHGMPNNDELNNGDILSVDCGVYLNGFHSDSAYDLTQLFLSNLSIKNLDRISIELICSSTNLRIFHTTKSNTESFVVNTH